MKFPLSIVKKNSSKQLLIQGQQATSAAELPQQARPIQQHIYYYCSEAPGCVQYSVDRLVRSRTCTNCPRLLLRYSENLPSFVNRSCVQLVNNVVGFNSCCCDALFTVFSAKHQSQLWAYGRSLRMIWYTEWSKKLTPFVWYGIFMRFNLIKYWPIFKLISLSESGEHL